MPSFSKILGWSAGNSMHAVDPALEFGQLPTQTSTLPTNGIDAYALRDALGFSRREFMRGMGVAALTVATLPLSDGPIPTAAATTTESPSVTHKPQIFTSFPSNKAWMRSGRFERYPLWPLAGDNLSFSENEAEWTAFYRASHQEGKDDSLSGRPGFYQVFICKGTINQPEPLGVEGKPKTYGAGDFFCQWMTERDLANLKSSSDAMFLIKYQRFNVQPDYHPTEKTADDLRPFALPFLFPRKDKSGLPFNVKSTFLLGNALRTIEDDMTTVTMLESFDDQTVAPSHYHPKPIWHEFVYIQGGHLTPDGYYGPGGHLVSLPGCKEGPYLSTLDPSCPYPPEWPVFANPQAFASQAEPWPKIFKNEKDGVYGVLFVHYGPFARMTPTKLANWVTLKPHEMGPEG